MRHFKASWVALITSFYFVAIESVAWEITANVTEVTSKATSTHSGWAPALLHVFGRCQG